MKRAIGNELPRRAFVAIALASLAGRAWSQSPTSLSEPAPAELEPVHKIVADKHGLTLRVTTHGCTKKADFAHFTEPKGQVVTIAFARKRLDRCGQRAGQLDILFSYAELGLTPGQPVMVLNPLAR
jgi:hypothetical protein